MTATARRSVPGFVEASPLVRDAYGLAETVHAGPLGSGRTSIEHPVAVATLLSEARFPPHVLAAALLHDTVEDGGVEIERLRGATRPPEEKLEHYERSLWLLGARHPEVPFLDELEAALTRLRRLPPEPATRRL